MYSTIYILVSIITGVFCCNDGFKCVPIKHCSFKKGTDFLYPCNNGTNICCPDEETTRVIARTAEFPNECGIVDTDDRITGGEVATVGQFPWMALLGYKQDGLDLVQFLCGGSLISQLFILSAAHCINLPNLKLSVVRLGETNLATEKDCDVFGGVSTCSEPHIDVAVNKIIPHKEFNTLSLKNDIALIKMQRRVVFTNFIQPICLPFDMELRPKMFYDKSFMVAGWGKVRSENLGGSDKLMFTKVTIWAKDRCNRTVPKEVQPVVDAQICANGKKTEDACKGDSGGPLFNVTSIDGISIRNVQIGVVSFASAMVCGNAELPTIYTRVDHYLDWIIKSVKQ